jgi:hypothetical protein
MKLNTSRSSDPNLPLKKKREREMHTNNFQIIDNLNFILYIVPVNLDKNNKLYNIN